MKTGNNPMQTSIVQSAPRKSRGEPRNSMSRANLCLMLAAAANFNNKKADKDKFNEENGVNIESDSSGSVEDDIIIKSYTNKRSRNGSIKHYIMGNQYDMIQFNNNFLKNISSVDDANEGSGQINSKDNQKNIPVVKEENESELDESKKETKKIKPLKKPTMTKTSQKEKKIAKVTSEQVKKTIANENNKDNKTNSNTDANNISNNEFIKCVTSLEEEIIKLNKSFDSKFTNFKNLKQFIVTILREDENIREEITKTFADVSKNFKSAMDSLLDAKLIHGNNNISLAINNEISINEDIHSNKIVIRKAPRKSPAKEMLTLETQTKTFIENTYIDNRTENYFKRCICEDEDTNQS